jgi:GAF domain-containing protein
LADIWNRLHKQFQTSHAIVAARQSEEFVVVAASEGEWMGRYFPLTALAAAEPVNLVQGARAGLPDQALLLPIYGGAEQVGALLLGPKTNGAAYLPEEIEYLEGLTEQVADLIQAAQQQEAQAKLLQQEIERYAERPAVIVGSEGGEDNAFMDEVEDALRHMHQFAYLGQHPVAQLQVVEQLAQENATKAGIAVTHVERGKALHQLLVQAVEKLRPGEKAPAKHEVPARQWQPYLILHHSYIQGELTTDIMSWLYISESNYNRKRKHAAQSVAKTIQEMEQLAMQH